MRDNIGMYQGKRKDTEEWIQGFLLIDNGKYFICPKVSDVTFGDKGNRRRMGYWYEVFPQSLGEYTGFKDKKSNKIFEGDIVTFETASYKFFPCCVAWNDKTGQFITERESKYPMDKSWKYEIIGNIFDSPEIFLNN